MKCQQNLGILGSRLINPLRVALNPDLIGAVIDSIYSES